MAPDKVDSRPQLPLSDRGIDVLSLDSRTKRILTRHGITRTVQLIASADDIAMNNRIPELDAGFYNQRTFDRFNDIDWARRSGSYDKPSVRMRKAVNSYREELVMPGRPNAIQNEALLAGIDKFKAAAGERAFELVKRGITTADRVPRRLNYV
ncbi:MAG TPA: hypothetical protein VHE53_05535 [Patescibacteria group bacterium]|nr:hypothetical protein [Patescibacteria group bacterium]